MSIERFFVRPVTIVHPAQVAGYGDSTTDDFDTGTRVTVKGWLDQSPGSEVQTGSRDAQLATDTLYLPAGTAIDASCRAIIDGLTYTVEGTPADKWTPRGSHHIEVGLRYVDG